MQLSLPTLTLLLQTATLACIHYRGSMPFSDSLPFVATIAENLNTHNATLCTLNTTYNEHDVYQRLKNEFPDPEEKRKDEHGDGDKQTWGFRRWEMRCVEGVRGWIGVGLRGVGLVDERLGKERGQKKEMWWSTDVKEDVVCIAPMAFWLKIADQEEFQWDERWIFGQDVGCERDKEKEKRERGKEKKRAKAKEKEKMEGKVLSKSGSERRKEEAQKLILAAVGEKEDKEKIGGSSSLFRGQ